MRRERCCLLHQSRLTLQVRLDNGIMLPSVNFGTAGLGEHTGEAVKEALLAGYALADTAQVSQVVIAMSSYLSEWSAHPEKANLHTPYRFP